MTPVRISDTATSHAHHTAKGGTLVTTRESWAGAPVEADPEGMRVALEGSLLAWLDALKEAAGRSDG